MKVLFPLLAILFHSVAYADGLPEAPFVSVKGEHSIRVKPDMLRITLIIAEATDDIESGKTSIDRRVTKLIEAAKGLGVAGEDITASTLGIEPNYLSEDCDDLAQTLISYEVDVTLRELEIYSALLNAIVEAQVTEIESINLSSSKKDTIRHEALKGAVENAKNRASDLATSFGSKIGGVYSIIESDRYRGSRSIQEIVVTADLATSSTSAAFLPTAVTISESVHAVFLLEQR